MSNVIPAKDLSQFKGAKKDIKVLVSDSGGSRDITNDKLTFYLYLDSESTPVITKDTDTVADFEKANQSTNKGEATIHLLPADTTSLDIGRYTYAVWIEKGGVSTDIEPFITGYYFISSVGPSIVDRVRKTLDEGAELGTRQLRDEIVPPTETTKIFSHHARIKAVQGVWLATDPNHAGTNYYTGGGFRSSSGEIWLGTPLPDIVQDLRINYTWESGISNEAIWHHLTSAQTWVEEFSGDTFVYGGKKEKRALESMAMALTTIMCVMTINGGNVAQMGYNFRIGDFEVQTKLWGEGMIAGEIFKQYNMELERWMQVVGRYVRFSVARSVTRYYLKDQLNYLGQSSISSGSEGADND